MENKKTAFSMKKLMRAFKKNSTIIILGIAGLVLVWLASGWMSEPETPAQQSEISQQEFCEQYVENLEQRLQEVVCSVSGVSGCEVMITLKTGLEYIYATDGSGSLDIGSSEGSRKEQSQEKVTVITDKQTGEKALIVTEKYPEINGVAIVCDGPESASIILSVKNAAATVLGIDTGKVCVIMKG